VYGLHHCIPLIEVVKKTYIERPIWSPNERVMRPRKCTNYRYYWSEITGTTGSRRFDTDMNYWYYQSETGITDGWW
jgi:hypothetical protein